MSDSTAKTTQKTGQSEGLQSTRMFTLSQVTDFMLDYIEFAGLVPADDVRPLPVSEDLFGDEYPCSSEEKATLMKNFLLEYGHKEAFQSFLAQGGYVLMRDADSRAEHLRASTDWN